MFLDEQKLASCSDDSTIKIWDYLTSEVLFELRGHTNLILSLEILPSGFLASGSLDKTVKIWDLLKKCLFKTLLGHTDGVFSVKEVQDWRLVSCALDNTIKVWNAFARDAANLLILTIGGHGNVRGDIQLGLISTCYLATCSNSLPFTAGNESVVRIWNVVDGNCEHTIPIANSCASCMVVLSNGRLAVGFTDGSIKIIDPQDRSVCLEMAGCHEKGVWSLAHFNGYLLSTGSQETAIKIWSSEHGQLVQTMATEHRGDVNSIAFSNDGHVMATASDDATIRLMPVDWKKTFHVFVN